ncbi:Protease OS=Streptomyces microflavus OX=1919 GN=Smic_43120 PE=4 SV=1 [Streptomyces microflavus]
MIGGVRPRCVGQLGDGGASATGSTGTVQGTTVSQSSKGTVSGVAEAVPAIVEIGAASSAGSPPGPGW